MELIVMKRIFLFLFLLNLMPTYAATFVVVNTNDSGTGSLREAINQVNAAPMQADIITFNIPQMDPNFNAITGVFTITLTSTLPIIQSISVTIDGTSQPEYANASKPVICLTSNTNLVYGLAFPLANGKVNGLIINNFQYGVSITKYSTYPSGNCTVENCFIGTNEDGSVAKPNSVGVAILGADGNTIKNNLISGNTLAGIGLRKSNTNTIAGNKIGTDLLMTTGIPNYYGVAIDSSSMNTIGGNTASSRNIISGNSYAGVAINDQLSSGNTIKGNYIGINEIGIGKQDIIANKYGIAINESPNNIVGGNIVGARNVISGNSEAGIAIMGASAKNNKIWGNYIGTNIAGNDSIPNSSGIMMSGCPSNEIGGGNGGLGNLISGNTNAGIVIAYTGANFNTIQGNLIGTDYLGASPLGNYVGVYFKSNANQNKVGGTSERERNIVSANYEMGIITEASDSNLIVGNYIGPDITGLATFRDAQDTLIQGNGVMFNTNSKYNQLGGYLPEERNVVSGNRIYGHDIYGNSSYNLTIGNYIGVDASGNNAMPNATGVCVDGGSNHNPFINNVFSGNMAYGIFIVTTGSYYNELYGNKIGTNAAGTSAIPNQAGLLLGGGARYNIIGSPNSAEKNIISGNRVAGIEIADQFTSFNQIVGNHIGTDITGTQAIPNQHGIAIASNPSQNNIENNLISGNNELGILLYEGADSNSVFNNRIGTQIDGVTALKNNWGGIYIDKNSNYNQIGSHEKGNVIAYSDSVGIVVFDNNSKFNTFSGNQIFGNMAMGIDLFPKGVNANDEGDVDDGANEKMNYPVIADALHDPANGYISIHGTIDCNSYGGPEGIRIELFVSDNENLLSHGYASKYLGFTTADANGNWIFNGMGANIGDKITATATDVRGNTSEFALNYGMIAGIENEGNTLSFQYYPNPANHQLRVEWKEPLLNNIQVEVLSMYGQAVYFKKTSSSLNALTIPTNQLENGMYLLIIKEGSKPKKSIKFSVHH